jgi:hypothetical protein
MSPDWSDHQTSIGGSPVTARPSAKQRNPIVSRSAHASVHLRQSARAATTTTSTALSAAGVAFVVNILMSRQLGPGARGDVAWALQGAYVLGPAIAFGLDRQALRGRTLRPSAMAHVWLLSSVGAVAAAAFGFSLSACVLVAGIGAVLNIERSSGMAFRQYRRYLFLQFGYQTWILATSLFLFVFGVNVSALWLSVYVAPYPIMFAFWVVAWLREDRNSGSRRWRISKVSFGQSARYTLGSLSAMLSARVERLLLPILASSSALGLYMAVATASELLLWVGQGLSENRVMRLVGRPMLRRSVALAALRDLSLFTLAGGLLTIPIHFILLPALGTGFSSASTLVLPLCMASAAWATYRQVEAAWIASATAGQSGLIDTATAMVTTVFAAVGILTAGALGAALGCLLAYLAMIVVAVVLWPVRHEKEDSLQLEHLSVTTAARQINSHSQKRLDRVAPPTDSPRRSRPCRNARVLPLTPHRRSDGGKSA